MRKLARVDRIVITCEHGGNSVPAAYRGLFGRNQAVLKSHRGYDIGALKVAQDIARGLSAPLHQARTTRLLIDLNRSLHHRACFSGFSKGLAEPQRRMVIESHYRPYRTAVERRIAAWVARGQRVLHLSVHSFTPVLRGVRRTADIGLLYDPHRPLERELAGSWMTTLGLEASGLRVRRNYPYRGTSDGFTTALRRRFPARLYLGIELEMNQRLLRSPECEPWLRAAIVESLQTLPQRSAANSR